MPSRPSCVVMFCAALLSGSTASAEVIDRVLAVVNGSVITLSDVHAATQFAAATAPPADRAAVVQRLIDRTLMLHEVDRYAPPEPKAEQVDAAVAAVRARFASAAAFEAALAATGLTAEQLRRQKRDDLRLDAYLQQRFALADQPADGTLSAEARAARLAQNRDALIADWIAGLRRRAEISVLPF